MTMSDAGKGLGLAIAMALLAAPPASAAPEHEPGIMSQSNSTEQNRQIVETAFKKWADTGTGFFDEVVSRDVVWTIKGSGPSAGTHRGRDAFVETAVRPFSSRMSQPVRPVTTRVWADGDHVVVNFDGAGVARDGVLYRNSYAWILLMQNGKAVEVTAFLDLVPYDDVLRRIPASPVLGQP